MEFFFSYYWRSLIIGKNGSCLDVLYETCKHSRHNYTNNLYQTDIEKLKSLIKAHHKFYVSFFKQLKPKHHFMVHYPNLILKIGPISQVWCMRLEGKHRELKRYSNSTTSRKNLPLSLLLKQQLKFSARVVCEHGIEHTLKTAKPAALR